MRKPTGRLRGQREGSALDCGGLTPPLFFDAGSGESPKPNNKSGVKAPHSKSEVLLRQLDDLVERRRVVHRDIGKRLAVEGDIGFLQGVDELTVADAAHAAGGVDADDPQAAKFAFANAPVAE